MKKIITFFLASSIEDLYYDRLAIGDFISQLNNIYQNSDLFIRLYKCESETMNHSITVNGSQSELDQLIKESDMCFVIFWHKAGEFTVHELKLAIDNSKIYNKPKVVAYFKNAQDNEEISDDVKNVMRIIDEELLHYHREYQHIDSLKLGIITQLQVHGFINGDITVQDNAIMCSNNYLMKVDSIPLFSENDEYLELLEEYKAVVLQCTDLQNKYAEDNGNYKVYRQLSKALKEKERLKSDLEELTNNIFEIGQKLASMTANGGMISNNIRSAIKCFDNGDYEGVLDVLKPEDLVKNVSELDELEKAIANERIAIVEEYRIRILALKALARWNDIYKEYDKAISVVQNRPNLPKVIIFEYALFLFNQGRYDNCIAACQSFEIESPNLDNVNKAKVDSLIGLAYYKLQQYDLAYERLNSSMQIRKELARSDSSYDLDYAESCHYLAKVYYYLNRHQEADILFNEALSIYNKYPDNDKIQMPTIEINVSLSKLYYQINKHEEAQLVLIDVLNKCIILSEVNPKYLEYVADISNRLTHINIAVKTHKERDLYYIESLKTRSCLLSEGKEAFVKYLENIKTYLSNELDQYDFNDYAGALRNFNKTFDESYLFKNEIIEKDFSYYDKEINLNRVRNWCSQLVEIFEKLSTLNPEAYESRLSEAYRKNAQYFLLIDDYDSALKYLTLSLNLEEHILSFSKDSYNGSIASTYALFGELYREMKDLSQTEMMYLKAISIYKKLSLPNELARTYNHLGRACIDFGIFDKALANNFNSLMLYLELFVKSPGAYIDRIINVICDVLRSIPVDDFKKIMKDFVI